MALGHSLEDGLEHSASNRDRYCGYPVCLARDIWLIKRHSIKALLIKCNTVCEDSRVAVAARRVGRRVAARVGGSHSFRMFSLKTRGRDIDETVVEHSV